MRKEIKITNGNGITEVLRVWAIAGDGVRLSAFDLLKVFDDEGFRSHLQQIIEESEPLYVEDAEVVTLSNLIEAVYGSTNPELIKLFNIIQEVEDNFLSEEVE